MRISILKATIGSAAVIGSSATCAIDWRGEPVGEASDGQAAYCILNVHTDPTTVHFEGPKWLLGSGEGAGPMLVDVRVQKYMIPAVSSTTSHKPDASTVSHAVGYNMTQWFGIHDYTRVNIEENLYQRVEAYPAFQRSVWEIHDASCGTYLGTGASYRPIGIYFKVIDAAHLVLPDVGVQVIESLDDGVVVPGGPPPDEQPPAADAGAGTGSGQRSSQTP